LTAHKIQIFVVCLPIILHSLARFYFSPFAFRFDSFFWPYSFDFGRLRRALFAAIASKEESKELRGRDEVTERESQKRVDFSLETTMPFNKS